MPIKAWLRKYIFDAGINELDSAAKTRAIRISNAISLTAVVNCILFGTYFNLIGDTTLFNTCMFAGVLYTLAHLITYSGHATAGRVALLISGNLVIFYCTCAFRGEANFQYFFFSLCATTFMHFSWAEKKYYALISLPIVLLLIGDFYGWTFFTATEQSYDLRYLRLFAMLAPLFQVSLGFMYFLKQSMSFEDERNDYLRKLQIEHTKQIQIQKMSSLGEMAGGVAHEINNPLMVIIGTTYNLKKSLGSVLPPGDPSFAKIEKIDSMVQRIVRIIQALKNISRNSEHDPSERVEIETVISSTLDLCRERFIINGIELEISGEKNLEVNCRPTEISQVILNLLNNAFDATNLREGGKVSIISRKLNNQYEIIIEDNGSGIPAEIVDKIMQPFFTTKEVGKGTGLGLSISKGLIESHHGTLVYIPGKGKTTFQILLPSIS